MASRTPMAQNAIKVKKYDSAHATEMAHIKAVDQGLASTLDRHVISAIADTRNRIEKRRQTVLEELGKLLGKTDTESVQKFNKLIVMI